MIHLNEHAFVSTDKDAECQNCGLQYRLADAWKTRCRKGGKAEKAEESGARALADAITEVMGGVWP